VNLVCDHVVLEQILCPIDILPPIIMDDTMVGAESSPEFLGENNGKKPDCEVIGEPRYVTMPGSCYKKPPPFCPIVVDDAPPTAAVEDEDDGDEDDEVGNDDQDEDVDAETDDTIGRQEESARLRKRHGALHRRHNQHGHKHPHCRKPHKKCKVPHYGYGGNNDTWAGLCVQTGFFCADRLFACGLDPKVLYSCDQFGYPPNINVTCNNACVNGDRAGQDRCDSDAPTPMPATGQEPPVAGTTEPLQPSAKTAPQSSSNPTSPPTSPELSTDLLATTSLNQVLPNQVLLRPVLHLQQLDQMGEQAVHARKTAYS